MEVFKQFRPGHELVISKFQWNFHVPYLQTTDGKGKDLDSTSISPKETPDRNWIVSVYDSKTHLRIFLIHYDSAHKRVNIGDPVLVKMWILNGKGHKFFQQSLTPNPSLSYVIFQLSKEEILKSNCQQIDGSLMFCFKVVSHSKIVAVSSAVPSSAIDCSGGLITHFEQLFDDMKFSDVIFKIGGREFPAHKLILSTRSEYFAAMFKHPTKENLSGQIEIKDIDPEVFHQLLRFIYTGRLDSTTMEKMAANLFILADKYLIDELKSECLNYLLLEMSPKNCVVLLLHGDLQNPVEYLKKAAKFFRHFPSEVMATDEWKEMKKENPTLLCNIHEFVYHHK